MSSVNKVFICGNVTADPIIQKTKTWLSVLNLCVATNKNYKQSNWEEKDMPSYHNITCWSALADIVVKSCKKWDKVMIEWFLQYSQWEQEDGQKRTATKIVAENVVFLSKPKQNQETPQYEEIPF